MILEGLNLWRGGNWKGLGLDGGGTNKAIFLGLVLGLCGV